MVDNQRREYRRRLRIHSALESRVVCGDLATCGSISSLARFGSVLCLGFACTSEFEEADFVSDCKSNRICDQVLKEAIQMS